MKKIEKSFLKRIEISTDQLYPLIVIAGLSFLVSLIPLPPNDFWWHLKIGEIIYTQGSIPSTNIFAWSIDSQTSFTYGAWLGELLLFLIYKLGGLQLISFSRNLLILLVYGLVGYETFLSSNSWRLASIVIAFLGLMTLNNLAIRPQIFTWLIFIAFLFLLRRYAEEKIEPGILLALPILMMAWVNVHGTFILGGVLIGISFTSELVQSICNRDNPSVRRKAKWLFVIGCLTGLSMLANPNGFGIIGYVSDLMTDHPSQSMIMEWQSPTPAGLQNTTFYISILLLLVVSIYSRIKLTIIEILQVVSFLWLAWTGQRYVIWYGITVLPIIAKMASQMPIQMPRLSTSKNLINVLLAILLFIPSLAVLPWRINRFPLPAAYWDIVLRDSNAGPLISTSTPVAAVEYLRTHRGGKLFNEMGYGSYLIWSLPEEKVFIDPRVELYSFEQWDDYRKISYGIRYSELLSKYGVERLLLDKKLQNDLVQLLPTDSKWQLEYEDPFSQVWKQIQ